MKKLLLILSAVFVSVMGYGDNDASAPYTLNPYAYDLSSSWDNTTKKLTVNFKLNGAPNLKNEDNPGYAEPRGIQIYAVDSKGKEYRIYGPSEATIKEAGNKGKGPYRFEIDLSAKKATNGETIPEDEELTWKVVVKGKSNRATTMTCTNAGWRPCHTHGVAVSKNQDSKHFGKVFVSEFSDAKPAGWEWLTSSKVPGLLEYDPIKLTSTTTADQAVGHKGGTGLEPHRVRISEDGRIFVTSYPYRSYPNKTGTSTAVWEFVDGTYRPIITCDANGTGRVVAMDVKGSGPNLKMLVCEVIPNQAAYSSGQRHGQLRIREYSIGTSTASQDITKGSQIITYNDYRSGTSNAGMIYQAYNGKWYMASKGMVNIAYGAGNAIWLKLAFNSYEIRQRIVYFDRTNNCSEYYDTGSFTYNGMRGTTLTSTLVAKTLGGDGLLIQGDTLITADIDKVHLFKIGNGGTLSNLTSVSTVSGTFQATSNWVNDFAIDPAHNLYAVSADPSGAKNLMVVSLPYSGAVTTHAPAGNTFTLSDPIPNILATDLRYEPVPKQPKYRFSFNVNTKPAVAQIRFYKSYGDNGDNDMKKNLAKINADDYQGGNEITPSFVYNIPDKFLKQGEIAVEFDMVGGIVENGVLTNTALPRGEWHWSVYVEAPRKSTRFAPIYKQGSTGEDTHCRLHATINNYPETDQFGWIIAAQYDTRAGSAKKGLMLYGFNPTGNSNDEQSTINNNVRYKLIKEYINPTTGTNKFENQRRLAVAPDGKVFIADYGNTNNNTRPLSSVMPFKNGGIWLWDPAKQSESSNTINLSLFLNSTTETANGLAIYKDYNDETKIKLYGTNTYGEFEYHGKYYEEAAQEVNGTFGKNGIKEYELGKPENIYQKETQNTITRQLGAGDGNGNISIVTMDKGIWIAQHRLNDVQYALDQFKSGEETNLALPDNPFNYILSFVPYKSSTRTWTSCSSNGVSFSASNRTYEFKADASDLTQKTTSPLQSCPGAGLAYRKITAGSQKGEYLYIVNHEGNIVELQITSWNGNKPTIVYKKTLPSAGDKINIPGTTRKTGAISTINFDYAGNLITTSGTEYLGSASQDLIVYTMPYDRVNAREIQAPNSCRFIPERTAYLEPRTEMELTLKQYIQEGNLKPCYLDIFRPMPNTSFSTICLPFDLDMKQLTTEALKDAEVKQYTDLQLSDIGGEQMLELVFKDVPTEGGKQILKANTPYIIQPKVRIPGIIKLQMPIQFVAINEKQEEIKTQNEEYAITFKGVIPTQQIKVNQPLTLLLVAENRLAEMVPDAGTTGTIYGFRGYFELNKPLNGIGARIAPKQSVSTSTTIIVDGKRVNINKYLREGRVYIRMGDTLYTIDGQKVQ